eukprot:TRINITY_DN6685_c4_g1_i1.p3 TRINITY_DN6685_c4_g1~~TRINITY_DN6685_c4_g1_i1.p3  ORF type:complete len:100 (+),score=22.37 TRINITY_DN6685_c4_g1_i1:153-452(+)
MDSSVDDTFARLLAQKDVKGLVVLTNEGAALKFTMDEAAAAKYARMAAGLVQHSSKMVTTIDGTNRLANLRIDSKKEQVTVCPGKDFSLVIIREKSISS